MIFAWLNEGEEGGGGGAISMRMIRGLGVILVLGVVFVGG